MRLIPDWTLKEPWEVRGEEQLPGAPNDILKKVELWDPMPFREISVTYGEIFRTLRDRTDLQFPGMQHMNTLLHLSTSFAPDWQALVIELWGTIFRDETGRAHVKAMEFHKESGVWLPTGVFVGYMNEGNGPLENLSMTLNKEDNHRIAYVIT